MFFLPFKLSSSALKYKLGAVVLVPKPGSKSTDPADMRPITLLPEIGKLVNRVLAKRFSEIVHANPTVMDSSQRAHLHDGSSRDCLHTVLNVCEDFAARSAADPSLELILTSYDVKKAFDSVQRFSIRASCDRFNLPPLFADLLINSLEGAISRVVTRDGLTGDLSLIHI